MIKQSQSRKVVPDADSVRKGAWQQTFTGVQFWPMDARVEDINIEDIAHHLSLQCRFSGACREFYSVAEHSVRVSDAVSNLKGNREEILWGLLHDASEAYLVDIPRPLKLGSELGRLYRDAEKALMRVICQRFGLPVDEPDVVSRSDSVLLMTEKRDLMCPAPALWEFEQGVIVEPLSEVIVPWTAKEAERVFLDSFYDLEKLLCRFRIETRCL